MDIAGDVAIYMIHNVGLGKGKGKIYLGLKISTSYTSV